MPASSQPHTASRTSSFKYKPQFGVIVLCKDERDQARMYERLKRGPRKVKVVTV
ncbi:MAG: hypothetical protein HZC55_26595 [Verrucomicrobia bacterium]|nr:hypothetical protein [Verrucomicrobiota bacterium]